MRALFVFACLLVTLEAHAQYDPSAFNAGAAAVRERQAARDQAERERAAQEAALARQQDAQSHVEYMDRLQRLREERDRTINTRKDSWNNLISSLRVQLDMSYQAAFKDSRNENYSYETHRHAREAMERITENSRNLSSITPDFETQEGFSRSISYLPSPVLNYTCEPAQKPVQTEGVKKRKR